MAERSFAGEVHKLRLGKGDVFSGEGILAITKALLENGVSYVGGYQGSPISHLMDVLADSKDVLAELGVHFETSASEATAAAMLAASVHYPMRGAVTFKSTVGTNVASDALANLSSGGVTGGALVIVGEDYGEGSSIMQERSHAFAMKSQIWLLDPRPNLPAIVKAVGDGFELSEISNSPVMLLVRIRSCHVHGHFNTEDNRRPETTVEDALANPKRDTQRVVLPPASFSHEQEKINQRLPAAIEFVKSRQLNEFVGPEKSTVGIITLGGLYNGVMRALQRHSLADYYGSPEIPVYVLNVAYPLINDELIAFCSGKDAVLIVEEGAPKYIEDQIAALLHRRKLTTAIIGEGPLPAAGELTGQVLFDGLAEFLGTHLKGFGSQNKPAPVATSVILPLADIVPNRPPGFCIGCPERPIFAATKLAQNKLGESHIASDIGCHLFSTMPPFEIGATTMGYGLGPASAAALSSGESGNRSISFIGDGGFWHNGLTSSIGNAVFNKSDGVIVVVDNFYSAATGGQDILSSRAENSFRSTKHPITEAVRGIGVKWIRQIDNTYDVGQMLRVLTEALTTKEAGPKVIVASSECMLNRQRREGKLVANAIKAGKRILKPRFGVDEAICTGDHACIRLSGCPSLTVKSTGDLLRDDPVAHIDQSCVGCGNCGEVADAAVLCPSFYRIDLINNPGRIDRTWQKLRRAVIGKLQTWRESRRLVFDE